ncbi:hypothetical protein BC832DRAFT_367933 [Gaertneriomyces semiglobifer]|nr:hypothetical protein BC832DRAFT_367933 [Gaertneriomyces semiglobifer]
MPQNNQQQLTDGAKKATVTVLGAGVVGLTTGACCVLSGYYSFLMELFFRMVKLYTGCFSVAWLCSRVETVYYLHRGTT